MNIILIGMPGAGKSTLGVLLAKTLGMDFIDTDIIIQQNEKKLLRQIIDVGGIEYFLAAEEKAICGLRLENCVTATGGSAVYSQKAMDFLCRNGTVIYLYLPYNEVERRIKNIKNRGVVIKKGKTLQDVYRERSPLYEKYADITVDCSGKDIESCVNEIVYKIKEAAL